MRIKDTSKEQSILNAAVHVFAKDGFSKAKMHTIADTAGIAAGTIYLYFKNKESILLKIFDQTWSQIYEKIQSIQTNQSIKFEEKLYRILETLTAYFTENQNLALVFANEENLAIQRYRSFTKYHEKTMRVIDALAIQGMSEGALAPGLSPVFFSAFVFGGMRFWLNRWALDPVQYPLKLIGSDIPRILRCGNTQGSFTHPHPIPASPSSPKDMP